MKSHPFPLSGGRYRIVDGEMVRDDDTSPAAPAPAAPVESPDPPATARRARHTSTEE